MGRHTPNADRVPCDTCGVETASQWHQGVGDGQWHCGPCVNYRTAHNGQWPPPVSRTKLDATHELVVPLAQSSRPCPDCGTTTSTVFQRLASEKTNAYDDRKYCMDCWTERNRQRRRQRYLAKKNAQPVSARTRQQVGVAKNRPLKYPLKASPVQVPCPWCRRHQSAKWRRIAVIADGKFYCNTCSTHFTKFKRLKSEHRNKYVE